ncbi:MAG TPA: T9SS type A sorting domain-containing protein [Bacteroidota bacterium]|nr:T9SS type A sorting domain-containing protein [Bacteroidota bacterium]
MKDSIHVLLFALLFLMVAQIAVSQSVTVGKQSSAPSQRATVHRAMKPSGVTSALVGPVFPPPLGVNFTQVGGVGAISRTGGENWFFSGAALSQSTTMYWGPQDGQVQFYESSTFTPPLLFSADSSNLAGGIAVWFGSATLWDKTGSFQFVAGTKFIMTVTDSVTGLPISLTSAGTLGLPPNVGAVVPVTPTSHFLANLQFFAGGMPALDYYDLNVDGIIGQAISSFTAGFYYSNIPPTISSIADQFVTEGLSPVGPLSFKVTDVETLADSLKVTAYSGNTTLLPDSGIALGGTDSNRTITLTPAPSQIGTSLVTITVSDGTDSTSTSFTLHINLNTLSLGSLEDNDGSFGTTGDRTSKQWHLEIHSGSAGGPLVASGDSTSIQGLNLLDGTYYAVESDSSGWIHMGVVVDGVPTATGSSNFPISLAGGQHSTINFVNAPPVFGELFRSFRQDSIAYDKDNLGKLGKLVKTKATRVFFEAALRNDSTGINSLHVEFGIGIDQTFPFYTVPPSTIVPADLKNQKWDCNFTGTLNPGDSVFIYGMGNKGKLQKIGKYFWKISSLQKGKSLKNPAFYQNSPRLPYPNRVNVLFTTYNDGAFTSTNGMLLGEIKSGSPDSSKYYGWVLHKKYGDVLKSLYDKTALPPIHDGAPHGFGFVKAQGKLPRSKDNNVLVANLIALKLSIAASAYGITPNGFGELIYNDGTANPLNGMMVKDIAHFGDSLVMGYYQAHIHTFASAGDFLNLSTTIAAIDSAFEGPIDTTHFATSLVLTGVRRLIDVPFMHANVNAAPVTLAPHYQGLIATPTAYALYQNFPNPFNPTTVIQFDLPQPSIVTLRVYNILGQEVATLVDNELMQDGFQEVTFDAHQYASGIYFYHFTASSIPSDDNGNKSSTISFTKKMILVK